MAKRRNRFAGILQPRLVGKGEPESATLVLYDIENDKVRTRIAELCFDYGLERIQFSAFMGKLNRNRRQELALRIQDEIGPELARVRVIPICAEDLRSGWLLDQYRPDVPDQPPPRLRIIGSED